LRNKQELVKLVDNVPTNQLAVSLAADWSTRRQRLLEYHKISML